MCEAILELFKDEYERGIAKETAKARSEARAKGREEGREEGIYSTINSCKALNGTKEQTLALLIENFNLTQDNAETYMKKYW